jgi:hypothetical protein
LLGVCAKLFITKMQKIKIKIVDCFINFTRKNV